MDPWLALKADTCREFGSFSMRSLVTGIVTERNYRVLVALRLCQKASQSQGALRFGLPFLRIAHRLASNSAAVDLPWRTEIAGGLAITHGWGLVVNPGARIGRNVTLYHGVTLGRRDRIDRNGERSTDYPVIEDDVWIGPHAIIVGGVKIGRGSRIAGGAFVTGDVPPYSVVSGNPGAIVRRDCKPDVMNPAVI